MNAIVVPTIRPELISMFLKAWDGYADNIYVMLDASFPDGGCKYPEGMKSKVVICSHVDAPWYIPKNTDCCRSWAILKAYKDGAENIWTLDDDVVPFNDTVGFKVLEEEYPVGDRRWINTATDRMRGIPFNVDEKAKPSIVMGTWYGVLDYDSVAQLSGKKDGYSIVLPRIIARGCYAPICGMNLMWKREMTPLMYFLLMGQPAYPFDRFGDIWMGIIATRICAHLNIPIAIGGNRVYHERASNPFKNLIKEAPGIEVNEWFWREIDKVEFQENDIYECYSNIADWTISNWGKKPNGEYWKLLGKAMIEWRNNF